MNQIKKSAILFIGQAPRNDLEPEFIKIWNQTWDTKSYLQKSLVNSTLEPFQTFGALDGLSQKEIEALTPECEEQTLFTILPNGQEISLSKKQIEPLINQKIQEVSHAGYACLLLACTADFPNLKSSRIPVIQLNTAVASYIQTILQPNQILGVFFPLEQQLKKTQERWNKVGVKIVGVPLLPTANEVATQEASQQMKQLKPHLIVFDCVSYTSKTLCYAQNHIQGTMILASSIAINFLKLWTLT